MPTSPCPIPSPSGAPRPSSATSSSTLPSPYRTVTSARPPPACLSACQPLLDDPVGGQVDPLWHRPRLALDMEVDVEPGLTDLVEQPVEVREARLRGERRRRRLAFGAEHPEHAAHLGESRAPDLLDDEQRLALARLVVVQKPPDAAGLD